MYLYMLYIIWERERDFKELTHMIMGIGKSEICRAVRQARDPRRDDAAAQVWWQSGGRISSYKIWLGVSNGNILHFSIAHDIMDYQYSP